MHDLNRRREALSATMARWQGRAFAWGAVDCVRIGTSHLRAMGHHLALGLHKAGSYRTALGAKRALARAGHDSIAAALDGVGLDRIAPAAALPGDFIVTPGTEGWEALTIAIGNGAVLGFPEDGGAVDVIRIGDWTQAEAWRL